MKVWTDDKEAIEIEFPQEDIKRYLRRVGTKKTSDLGTALICKVLLYAIKDFKYGKLSTDQLAAIAGMLNHNLLANHASKDKSLETLTHDLGEMAFYIRHKSLNIFPALMKSMWQYYEENKHLIE